MSLPENFCSAPFLQLQTSKDDRCGPCPYTPNIWKIKGNISDKWQSKELENLRKNFLDNKQDPQCTKCWKEEKAGKKSLRIRLSEAKESKNSQKIFDKYISTKKYFAFPKILTLIPGNECNLACPSCNSFFSSKWNSQIKQKNYNGFQKTTDNWNLTDKQYQDIVDNSQNLQKIELFGGEPFLNKQNKKQLIEKLIQKGTSKNIKLYFNTNGTLFDEKYMEELTTKFKFVEIRQSIDGIYDQFEYLRYGAKFDKVCENAEKFSALPNSDFAVICTISNYNLLGIDAIDEFMQKRNWIVYYNVANTPDYLLLHNLPEEVKNYIKLPERFSDIHQYMTMEKCDLNTWKRFVDYTRLLDRNRGLSFKTTFKDLYSLVKKHGFE
tara:strand:- start:119 stop:1258 length:1140 start_codon:yes stop_codon:yes gene_type:complete